MHRGEHRQRPRSAPMPAAGTGFSGTRLTWDGDVGKLVDAARNAATAFGVAAGTGSPSSSASAPLNSASASKAWLLAWRSARARRRWRARPWRRARPPCGDALRSGAAALVSGGVALLAGPSSRPGQPCPWRPPATAGHAVLRRYCPPAGASPWWHPGRGRAPSVIGRCTLYRHPQHRCPAPAHRWCSGGVGFRDRLLSSR